MKKFFKTMFLDINIYLKEYFVFSVLGALIIFTVAYIAVFLIYKQKSKKKIFVFPLILNSLYFSHLLYITIFYRIGKVTESSNLSDIFGEWSIFDGETSMYVNPKPILNIILFLPLCFLLFFFIKKFFNKTYSNKKLLIYSTVISFSVSSFIELTQLIFSLGTFQISDLAYNTLGGLAGAVIYIIIKKFSDKKAVQIK